jgi:hypothetical protein
MTPEEIDRIFAQSGGRGLDPDAIERAKAALPGRIVPVRPLAPPSMFLLAFLAAFAVISVACASLLGMAGLRALDDFQRAVIFPLLVLVAAIAALAAAREMRPAGGRRIGRFALAASTAGLLAAFAFLLRDYATPNFVPQGIRCLVAGLVCAIPTAAILYLFLRRGFVLDWPSAGLALGTLAGLSGVAMLEMHCPILQAPHVMFWHVAVVPLAGTGGWLLGVLAQSAGRSGIEKR